MEFQVLEQKGGEFTKMNFEMSVQVSLPAYLPAVSGNMAFTILK